MPYKKTKTSRSFKRDVHERLCFLVLQLVRKNAQSERLGPLDSLVSRSSIDESPWDLNDFTYPAAVSLLFGFNVKDHNSIMRSRPREHAHRISR